MQGEAVMTQFPTHTVPQQSRFNSVVIGALTAVTIILAGFLPFTLFATN
jgi:hypothetical protein